MTPGTNDPVPCYARPTQASNNRRASNFAYTYTPRTPVPPSPQRWEVFRSYSASTIASRLRNERPMPFRFLDLPPELRNRIYEHVNLEERPHYADLQSSRSQDLSKALPSLLQVNKQLRDEAGSYYFAITKRFDIVLDYGRLHRFRTWLRIIGPINRRRLCSNPDVFVRLCQTLEHGRYGPKLVRELSFVDGAGIVGLEVELQQCASIYPALLYWQFSAVPVTNVERWRTEKRNISHFSHLPLAVADVQQIRGAMKFLMASLGGPYNCRTEHEVSQWLVVKKRHTHNVVVEGRNGKCYTLLTLGVELSL